MKRLVILMAFITYQGETHTLKEWSQKLNINYSTLTDRYRRGMSPEQILCQSKLQKGEQNYYPGEKPPIGSGIKTVFHDIENGISYAIDVSGQKIFIDTECKTMLEQYYWRINNSGYVETHKGPHGKAKRIFMHRLIMGVHGLNWTELPVDHKDRNPANNCRSNLRICTNAQNQINRGLRKDNTSGFTGVRQEGNRWYVTIAGQRIHGTYDTYEEAVTVRKQLEVQVYQEFSKYYTEKQSENKPNPTNGHEKRIYQYQNKMWTISELENTLNINHKTISKYYKQGLSIEEIVQKIKAK